MLTIMHSMSCMFYLIASVIYCMNVTRFVNYICSTRVSNFLNSRVKRESPVTSITPRKTKSPALASEDELQLM